MAQLLQHQDSSVLYAKYHSSCKWRWLQFLDFHQRGPSRKLLADSSSSSSHGDGKGNKVAKSYVPLKSTEHDKLGTDARPSKSLILNSSAKETKSGKALIRALLAKTLFGKYYRKKKIPLTPKLLRTLSIHHLECNDYVLQDEMSSDSETSELDSTEQGAYPLESSDKLSLLSRRRNSEAYIGKESVNHAGNHSTEKQKVRVGRLNESVTNDFVRVLGLLHVQREMLAKNLEDQKFISENDSTGQHTPRGNRVLNKSGSFPVIDKSDRRNAHPSKSMQRVFPSNHYFDHGRTSSVQINALNSLTMSNNAQTVSSEAQIDTLKSATSYASDGSPAVHIKDPKERLKDLNTERRKEYQRISKDALMHKIPYGKNVTDDLATPKLFRSSSARSHTDSSKENTVVSSRGNLYQGMQRSRSLTESLGRYSSLFENLSTKDFKRLQEKNLTQDDQTETIHATPLLSEKLSPQDDDEGHGTHQPVEAESVDSLVEKQSSDVDNGGTLDANLQPTSQNALEQNTMCKVSDSTQDQSTDTHMLPKVNEVEEEPLLHNVEMEKTLKLDQLENEHGATNEQELEFDAEQRTELAESTSASVLDIQPDGNFVGPENLYHMADSKIESETFDAINVNISDELEAAILNLGTEHKSEGLTSSDAHLRTQVDQKEESEFKYVKSLLLKSSFNGLELFNVLNGEPGGHLDELEVGSNDSDEVPLEQQVLLDMMNEELLDLYEKSSAHGWLPRFSSQLRPIPAGDSLLEEVWSKISFQVGGQVQASSTLVGIISQDFAKRDGWLSLLMDAESVGMEMESLILDQMLDELVFELVES